MSLASRHSNTALIGTAVFLSGLEFAIASTEMSSRYSVSNFSKDQKTLQSAADALTTYIIIALIWTIATCLVLFSDYGLSGILWGILTNSIFAGWIIVSYMLTFHKVSKDLNLQFPKIFGIGYSSSPVPRKIVS
jgi:hypothetical protein